MMFYGATSFNNGGVALTWGANTVSVVRLMQMFRGATSFNQDVSGWNTASVTNMGGMFYEATAFNNGGAPLTWGARTGAVTIMEDMFRGATSFNQDISGWSTAAVTSMHGMFSGATSFNKDLSSWNVGNVGYKCLALRGQHSREVDAAQAGPPRLLSRVYHCDQRSHGSLPRCRGWRYRCGQRRHVHEAERSGTEGPGGHFQRGPPGQLVYVRRDQYACSISGTGRLQCGHQHLGHELGDGHGGACS